VILRIKEICFELNNQIVTDVKLLYDDVIESQPDYQEKIKIYKSVQIYSYVKVFYNVKPREIPFDDFGKEEAIDFDSSDEIKELILQFKHLVKYELEVKRNSNGFFEPSSTWLPEKWKHELRIIAI
jgi:hypothetical protein